MIRIPIALALSAFATLFAPMVIADPGAEWIMIGENTIGAGEKNYTRPDAIQDWGDENYFAPLFIVYPVQVRGIEMVGPEGSWLNTNYPHRSTLLWNLYDCPKRMIATVESHYFDGEFPSSSSLVYMEKNGNPLLFPDFLNDPLMDYICGDH